jgi:NAD(P)-dependent dehydrogenase (short-subunit alcohol dehydrogenase family)
MTELRFDGKVAVVTGAGRGLGRAYARLLARRGARVVVNDPGADLDGSGSDGRYARQVADEIVADGGDAVANFDSIATAEGGAAVVDQALSVFGGLHIIVNNAGNFLNAGPFLDTTTERFLSLFQVHTLGTVHVIRAAWQHLMDQKYGRIINTSSNGGYYGLAGSFEYAAAKGAVHGLSRTLALEGAPHGINVNVIAPGAATRPVLAWATSPETFDNPAYSPDLVAPTVVWLAHEECRATGETFSAVAGATSRMIVAETRGFQNIAPTPEDVRNQFEAIMDRGDERPSPLVFPAGAVERGADLVSRFTALSQHR